MSACPHTGCPPTQCNHVAFTTVVEPSDEKPERNVPSDGGTKADDGKLAWHLLPLVMLRGVVRTLMYGAAQYGEWDWMNGLRATRLLDACQRHLERVQIGDDVDAESGLLHIDHAIANLLFLRYQIVNGAEYTPTGAQHYKDFDDRAKRRAD
jgi:hypothetical protein